MFIEALFTLDMIWKQPKLSINRWKDEEDVIHTHTHTHTHTHPHTVEYYSAIKKNENFPFATMWIDCEGIMISEVSQTDKDNILYDIMYMYNLKNTTKKKQTHSYREQTSGYQWWDGSNR